MTTSATPQLTQFDRIGDPDRPGLKAPRRFFTWLLGSDPHPTPAQVEEIKRHIQMGDRLADAVVAMYKTLPPGQGRKLLDQALENGIHTLTAPPQALVDLFEQIEREPVWLDRDKLNLACDVSRRVGRWGELVLRNMALMGGYLAGAASKPLVFTGQLDRMTPRRLVETTKFWIDVTTRGGLERNAEGFKSAVRVRMMHAQVRAMLLQSGKWDPAWGHPLNQWDSMGTIQEFSSIFLTGLRALGFVFSRREREAVIHLWRYVGYLMGVEERILPTCEADAMRAVYQAMATVCPADDDSRKLGQSLANVPLQNASDHWLGQQMAKLETTLRNGYSRYILGDAAGDKLGLPRTAAKYLWPAQIPLRLSAELVRISVPPLNKALIRRGEASVRRQFPHELARTQADTSFTPVSELTR